MGTPMPLPPEEERSKAAAERKASGQPINYPTLVDITASTGIHFDHKSSPAAKFIAESMSGGVALIDYDGDGWPDIYFTNAPSVDMALHGVKARSALFHNNHDGTFTDVTDKAGVGYPCFAMGAAVGDYNNDGRPDLLVTCLDGVVLYRNNGDGTFTDVTKATGLGADSGWATGAAFGDYDRDGWPDLFVSHYVDFHLDNLPAFGATKCEYLGLDVQCGPRGLKGLPDSLYHSNGDGTFTDVAKRPGWTIRNAAMASPRSGPTSTTTATSTCLSPMTARRITCIRTTAAANSPTWRFFPEWRLTRTAWSRPTWPLAVGDYAHTGRMSLVISHFDVEYAALYTNDGKMNFADASIASGIARGTQGYVGWGGVFVDFGNNGWQDYFLVNGHVYPASRYCHALATRFLRAEVSVSESTSTNLSATSVGRLGRRFRCRR